MDFADNSIGSAVVVSKSRLIARRQNEIILTRFHRCTIRT